MMDGTADLAVCSGPGFFGGGFNFLDGSNPVLIYVDVRVDDIEGWREPGKSKQRISIAGNNHSNLG
jgi:hypothetical protein